MNREATTHEWRCRPSFQPPMPDNDLMARKTACSGYGKSHRSVQEKIRKEVNCPDASPGAIRAN